MSSPKEAPFGGREHRCGVCFIQIKTDIECIQGYTRDAATSPLGPERLEVSQMQLRSATLAGRNCSTQFWWANLVGNCGGQVWWATVAAIPLGRFGWHLWFAILVGNCRAPTTIAYQNRPPELRARIARRNAHRNCPPQFPTRIAHHNCGQLK